jgi:hypothetical protein
MGDEKRSEFRKGPLLAVLLLGLLCLFIRRVYVSRTIGRAEQKIAQIAVPQNLNSPPRASERLPVSAHLDAKDIDASKAKRLIATGLWAYVNAKSSKLVMTSLSANSGVYASFTLVHHKSPTRGDLFRCETINFDAASMTPIPGLGRVEITNEIGNWEMREGAGGDGVAFLLKNNDVPTDTVGLRNEFKTTAQTIDSSQNNLGYTATNAVLGGKPVVNITETTNGPDGATRAIYTIDATNGGLLSMVTPVDGLRRDFDLAPNIDESDFNIPDSNVVVPVIDAAAAQAYLSEHK